MTRKYKPRTLIPQDEELIKFGEELVDWASEKRKNGESIRVRYCDFYTEKGYVSAQWREIYNHPKFIWYYERARCLLSLRYIDGTINASIAHRYLRMYDPELKLFEDKESDADTERKLKVARGGVESQQEETKKIVAAIERNKSIPKQDVAA